MLSRRECSRPADDDAGLIVSQVDTGKIGMWEGGWSIDLNQAVVTTRQRDADRLRKENGLS